MDEDIYALSDREIIQRLGERFRSYRIRYDKTQKEVAESAGLSIPTVGGFENGAALNLSLLSLTRILRAIGELEQIESLLPEIPVSPYTLLKMQSKQKKRIRKNKDGEHSSNKNMG